MTDPVSQVRRFRRRNRGKHQHSQRVTTITRTVTRNNNPALPDPPPEVTETVEVEPLAEEEDAMNPAFAATGGFVAGVLASLVAGLLVLLIERTINKRNRDGK